MRFHITNLEGRLSVFTKSVAQNNYILHSALHVYVFSCDTNMKKEKYPK